MEETITLESCVEACRLCARDCRAVVAAHPGKSTLDRTCAHAARDCAELASLVADFLERSSPTYDLMAALTKACHRCCQVCHGCEEETCKSCIAACERCSKECQSFSVEEPPSVGYSHLSRGL